ncbi:hypothetical protein [Coraliomargarita parva]|uniref:hypothetical protein n=1 Tax=Coraliomargarita parva TaxID=3014050 RepID=UPI0022B5D05C|nr:hypothetical protein [Coraliomargarita parva]
MPPYTRQLSLLIAAATVMISTPVLAEPMRGPLPAEQRGLIHDMAQQHEAIERTVEMTETGYKATTTSQDAEIAASLKAHVKYMSERLASGAMVRRWDPAFVEMIEHHGDISVDVEELEDGIQVIVTGKTPEAILVAQNHARIVSDFAAKGPEAVQAKHAKALEPDTELTAGDTKCGAGPCPKGSAAKCPMREKCPAAGAKEPDPASPQKPTPPSAASADTSP